MNFVFQGLALLAFILPGMLFRSAYKKAFWNYPLGRLGPITDQIPRSLVHASWLNATWAIAVERLSQMTHGLIRSIDFDSVVFWLTNNFGKDQGNLEKAVNSLTKSPFQIFLYFIGLYVYSVLWGWLIHLVIRSWSIDKNFTLFRFDNDWYYLFKGEVLDFPDYKEPNAKSHWWRTKSQASRVVSRPARMKGEDRIGTLVAAVVDLKDKSFLYLGIYVDSFWDNSGNLDRILLEGAKRRDLSLDAEVQSDDYSHLGSSRYYPIKGDFFILRMSEVKTLNLAYFSDDLIQIAENSDAFERLQKAVADLVRDEKAYGDDSTEANSIGLPE